jgi:hypothetical protein
MILQNQLKNLQTHYSVHPKDQSQQPHVNTIFSEPKKGVREFHVVETENPHNTSVVRVQPPTDESNPYSVMSQSIPWVPIPPPGVCRAFSTVLVPRVGYLLSAGVSPGVGNLFSGKKSNICRLFRHLAVF